MVEYQGHFCDFIHYPLVGKYLTFKWVGHLIYSSVMLECFLIFSMWDKDKLQVIFSLNSNSLPPAQLHFLAQLLKISLL